MGPEKKSSALSNHSFFRFFLLVKLDSEQLKKDPVIVDCTGSEGSRSRIPKKGSGRRKSRNVSSNRILGKRCETGKVKVY